VKILDARRAERSYFFLPDPQYIQAPGITGTVEKHIRKDPRAGARAGPSATGAAGCGSVPTTISRGCAVGRDPGKYCHGVRSGGRVREIVGEWWIFGAGLVLAGGNSELVCCSIVSFLGTPILRSDLGHDAYSFSQTHSQSITNYPDQIPGAFYIYGYKLALEARPTGPPIATTLRP